MKGRGLVSAAALASPLIWFASHASQFALAPLACIWQSNAVLWLASGVAMLLDIGSGLAAWSEWRREPAGETSESRPMPRWLAMSCIAMSGGFLVVILAQAIPSIMLAGCE